MVHMRPIPGSLFHRIDGVTHSIIPTSDITVNTNNPVQSVAYDHAPFLRFKAHNILKEAKEEEEEEAYSSDAAYAKSAVYDGAHLYSRAASTNIIHW